jgi:hypothetical protein
VHLKDLGVYLKGTGGIHLHAPASAQAQAQHCAKAACYTNGDMLGGCRLWAQGQTVWTSIPALPLTSWGTLNAL